ncbi:MAG: hypothetical protein EAZ60_00400 [Oscillatoriales cyanobacterium]|nr:MULTISPECIES: hypothetical protein [unclassified Microcoleus]TAE82482.1 MAG: hypothetical protein EAZ83_12470 [Oscillatoriales cyanobacterium]MCC3460754.1 hypothetical protein [Microcoleus sp. PH2017_11_PCY_U_A]MCC3560157.1 hypothetical protein [Microcoleus sp. PH2017_27_LUM_O_A]TAE95246.1 MAG: hypothetical protein EAZ79_19795 [Oscillatoriales cyanobacterium]TAF19965.1 MAG: hypothetical protein EAZ73_13930 [Oscillatoriales cyanobacterium]
MWVVGYLILAAICENFNSSLSLYASGITPNTESGRPLMSTIARAIAVGGRSLFGIALPRVLLEIADIRSRLGVGGGGAVPAGDRTTTKIRSHDGVRGGHGTAVSLQISRTI